MLGVVSGRSLKLWKKNILEEVVVGSKAPRLEIVGKFVALDLSSKSSTTVDQGSCCIGVH